MQLIVCMKWVPTGSLPLDDRGNLDRSRAGGELNSGDLYALEAALQIRETLGGSVTVLTMGPKASEAVLRRAFSMGADRGILLNDPAFAGADVYATAYTLAQAIKKMGSFQAVLCGQQSTDGDTAQLPFSLGAQLDIPALGWVKKLQAEDGGFLVSQELSLGTQQARIPFPCLLAVGRETGTPRIPSLRSQLQARNREVEIMTLKDLEDQNPDHYGLAGSHTRVLRVREIERVRKNPSLNLSASEGAAYLLKLCREGRDHG